MTVLYVPESMDGFDGFLDVEGEATACGTVLNLRTTTSQKCEAVPRRARIKGA